MVLEPFLGPSPLFQFLVSIHSRQDSLVGGSVSRKAYTYTQNANKHRFEHMILAVERVKRLHASDRVTTMIGINTLLLTYIKF